MRIADFQNPTGEAVYPSRALVLVWLHATGQQIEMAIEEGVLKEVFDDDEESS
jgi:hypothetical protein